MQIIIEYESSWRNSFLDGSNNEELPKKGRNYIGSGQKLDKAENFIQRELTQDTVMGILNRLIGDQHKLYQSRQADDYFFEGIESRIVFFDKPEIKNNEIVYLRNMTGSTDQNSFTGAIKVNDPIFDSDYSNEFWGVLTLNFDDLCEFIVDDITLKCERKYDPLSVVSFFENLDNKPRKNSGIVKQAVSVLTDTFGEVNYFNTKGEVVPLNVYCSALNLQLHRLSKKYDMTSAITNKHFDTALPQSNKNKIKGISKRLFTKKNFMDRYTTGKKKKVWGNPYMRKERIKGEGEVVSMLTKASGQLEINLDIAQEKARELKTMIDNAGVSSFYLGKKGLAYVSRIRL